MTEKTFIFHPYDMTSNDLSRPIMTSKLPEFNLSLCTYQIKAVNPHSPNISTITLCISNESYKHRQYKNY